jgi:hypothetical protein
MQTFNCRKDKMCILCKYWLGEEARVNFITGNGKVKRTSALCSQDGQRHNSVDICTEFKKCLTYL